MKADVHIVSDVITELLNRGNACQVLRAARGEFFLHHAYTLDLIAADGGPVAERARDEAQRYRDRGRAILEAIA
jgi:hypothetical protein